VTEPAPILDGGAVEDAVETTLRTFETTYLARIERAKGLEARTLPVAKSWKPGAVFEWEAVDQLPSVYIIGGDLEPSKRSHAGYTGTMEIAVAVVVEDQRIRDAARRAKHLLASYKTSLSEHPGLTGVSTDVRWTGDAHDILAKQGRRVAAAEATFLIHLPLGPYEIGPDEPPTEPYEPPADSPVMGDDSMLTITQEATP